MAEFATANIRTVALVGHGGAGKTTLAEALLAKAGAIPAAGQRREGHHRLATSTRSRSSTSTRCAPRSLHFDTPERARPPRSTRPGFPDFLGQAIGALAAVETAAIVVNAQTGIEMITDAHDGVGGEARPVPHDRRQQDRRRERGPARRARGDPAARSARSACRSTCRRTAASASSTASSTRRATPTSPRSPTRTSALVDQVVEVDEELMAMYLEQGESIERRAAARAVREGAARRPPGPGLLRLGAHRRRRRGAARRARQARCPIPPRATRRCSRRARAPPRVEFRAEPDPKKHVLAHVFKVVIDPFVGKLGVFRVHQGTVTQGHAALHRRRAASRSRSATCYMLQAARTRRGRRARARATSARSPRSTRSSSTACCTTRTTRTTSTWSRSSSRRRCTASRSQPKRRGDEQRLSDVLHKLCAEDPTLPVEHDAHANETVMRGLGELHLRSMLERMASQYKLEVDTQAAAHPLPRDHHRARPRATTATRSRPAARASSARCSCASSRCRAAPASSSSTR